MILDYTPPADVSDRWKQHVEEQENLLIEELDQVNLFSEVGEHWHKAGTRFQQVTFKKAQRRLETRKKYEVRWASNPGLKALHVNQSQLLNQRHHYMQSKEVLDVYEQKAEQAYRTMLRRTNYEADEDQLNDALWLFFDIVERLIWERLHADAIEAPFYELEFQILLAGHLPCGVEGKDWKTCKILYC